MDASGIASVHYNPHLSRYLIIYSGPDNTAALRTAARPAGPWSDALTVAQLLPPTEGTFGIYDVIAHSELNTDNGRRILFSYSRGTAPFRSETRLVEITLR